MDDKTKTASSSVYEFIEDRSAVPMKPKITDFFPTTSMQNLLRDLQTTLLTLHPCTQSKEFVHTYVFGWVRLVSVIVAVAVVT